MSLFPHYDSIRMSRDLSMQQAAHKLDIHRTALGDLKRAVMRYTQMQYEQGIAPRDTGIDEDLGYKEKMEFFFDIEMFVRWLEYCPHVVDNGPNPAINVNATINSLDHHRRVAERKWDKLDRLTKPELAHV